MLPSSSQFLENVDKLLKLSRRAFEDDCQAQRTERYDYRLWDKEKQCEPGYSYFQTGHYGLPCCLKDKGGPKVPFLSSALKAKKFLPQRSFMRRFIGIVAYHLLLLLLLGLPLILPSRQ